MKQGLAGWLGADASQAQVAALTIRGLLGCNFQIGKVTLRARPDPQCDSSLPRLEFQVVHLDLVPGPRTGLQIDVRLIFFRGLLPRFGEAEIRVRTVLRGVIPSDLIVRPAVGRSQEDVLVFTVGLQPKSNANVPACGSECTVGRLTARSTSIVRCEKARP